MLAGDQILAGSGPLTTTGPDTLDADPLSDYFAFLESLAGLPTPCWSCLATACLGDLHE